MSGLEKLVSKAKRLITDKRVVRIESGAYQVVGDHGTYIVVKGIDNSYHCGCPGYLNKGFCSHALAVTLLANTARRKKSSNKETKYSEIPPEVPIERIKSVLERDADAL